MATATIPTIPRDSAPSLPTPTGGVTLPPIAALDNYSYTTRFYQLTPAPLSDQNLSGLGLLVAVSSQLSSSPPLVSSMLRVSLPLLLPQLERALMSPTQKRRQRLGPLCDSCRSRKVKCDAEVSIIAKISTVSMAWEELGLTEAQQQAVALGELVTVDADTTVVVSNNKIIKFKVCKLCQSKGLTCCFSKGFTKEDMMMNNKRRDDQPAPVVPAAKKLKPAKIAKKRDDVPALQTIALLTLALAVLMATSGSTPPLLLPLTRKLLCFSCRKRKVKCAYNQLLNKCESCFKKNVDCMFDCKPNDVSDE